MYKKLFALLFTLAAMLCFTACSSDDSSSKATSEASVADSSGTKPTATVLGEGDTSFQFEVTGSDGKLTTFIINTNEKTVGAALIELGLIAGDDSDLGIYVKTVNGETVDFDDDGKYWAFYIDGEYAMSGVDSTDIVETSTYAFKVE